MVRHTAADIQLAELAAFTHCLLAGLHILGIAYNLKRRNWLDVAAHSLAAAYDVQALHHHVADIHEMKAIEPDVLFA